MALDCQQVNSEILKMTQGSAHLTGVVALPAVVLTYAGADAVERKQRRRRKAEPVGLQTKMACVTGRPRFTSTGWTHQRRVPVQVHLARRGKAFFETAPK